MKNKMVQRIQIQRKLKSIYEQQMVLDKEWEAIRKECNHQITITTAKNIDSLLKFSAHRRYCLFCREHLSPRKYLSKVLLKKLEVSLNIDMGDYPNIFKKWQDTYDMELENMYQELRSNHLYATEYEIGEMLQKRLEIIDTFL